MSHHPVIVAFLARPEVLYGRPALTALRAQRDSLHKLYCGYSGTSGERTGSAGVSRSTFLRVGAASEKRIRFQSSNVLEVRCSFDKNG